LYIILICLGEADKELIKGERVAQKVWDALQRKYTKQLPSQGRLYLHDFAMYQKSPDVSIQDTFAHLQNLARKIGSSRPNLKDVFHQEEVFQQLLASLLPEYSIICDAIDGQTITDIDVALSKL
jgi:hypothetical protein